MRADERSAGTRDYIMAGVASNRTDSVSGHASRKSSVPEKHDGDRHGEGHADGLLIRLLWRAPCCSR